MSFIRQTFYRNRFKTGAKSGLLNLRGPAQSRKSQRSFPHPKLKETYRVSGEKFWPVWGGIGRSMAQNQDCGINLSLDSQRHITGVDCPISDLTPLSKLKELSLFQPV